MPTVAHLTSFSALELHVKLKMNIFKYGGVFSLAVTATTPVLTDSKTLKEVVNCLTEYVPIQTQGKCEQQNIFEILIRAATQKDSIENTTKVLKNVPTSNDIRYHLEKYSDLASLEENLNKAVQSRLPTGVRQGQQKIAIDFNLIPCANN